MFSQTTTTEGNPNIKPISTIDNSLKDASPLKVQYPKLQLHHLSTGPDTCTTTPCHNDSYKPSIVSTNALLLGDLNISQTYKAFDRLYIYSNHQVKTHLGLGEYHQYQEALNWIPNHHASIKTGTMYIRQYDHLSLMRTDLWGLNADINYNLTNKLRLSIYGQLVAPNENMFSDNQLFPNSNYGSSMTYQVNNQTQIGVGMGYEYNGNKKKWEIESAGKVAIGF